VADCLAGDGRFGVVLIARGSEVGGGDQRVDVATLAAIERAEPLPDGRSHLAVTGLAPRRVTRWLADDPYPRALLEECGPTDAPDPADLRTAQDELRRVRALVSELGHAPALAGTSDAFGRSVAADVILWRMCALAPVTVFDRQRLLEAPDNARRLALLVELVRAVGDDVGRILAGE
jgi:Lon protease-like protein